MKVKYLRIKQNDIQFYICVINARILMNICSTSINDLKTEHEIYQRKLDDKRVKKIIRYAERKYGSMPTSVILNANNKLDISGDYINIDEKKDKFFIIDGQHRINAAGRLSKEYELPVVIFDRISKDLQSEYFVAINSEQKKVNSNVSFSMKSNDFVKTPEKVVYNIALKLNKDIDSPFFHKIRFDDLLKGRNYLSVYSFAMPIINYIYDKTDYYILKDELIEERCINSISPKFSTKYNRKKYFLWPFYANDMDNILYKIILNYFISIKNILSSDWNDGTILYKTTGYNALMFLFKDVFLICRRKKDFSLPFMYEILDGISSVSGHFSSTECGLGRIASVNLYKKLISAINEKGSLDYSLLDDLVDDE